MYVCMYVCVYVCVCVYMYICNVCMHICINVSMCVYIYECMYISVHVCMYAFVYLCMHACICVSVYVCNVYVCEGRASIRQPYALRPPKICHLIHSGARQIRPQDHCAAASELCGGTRGVLTGKSSDTCINRRALSANMTGIAGCGNCKHVMY
jgi:hypothetical protein